MPSLSSNDDVLVKVRSESDDSGVEKSKLSIDGLTGAFLKADIAARALTFGLGLLEDGAKTIWNLGESAFNSAAAFEQNSIAFRVMIGDAEKSKQLLKDISEFAAKTPFELPDTVEGAKRLLAYNVAADKIIPTLTSLGNIAAGVGRDKLPQLILAFGQVKAATHLTGMELRQFTEAGVPLLTVLAEQLHTTEGAVQEMVSAGQIGFPQVEQALSSLSAEGGRFFGLMQEQSTTYDGTISNLRDNFGRMGREIIGISDDGTIREGSIFQTLSAKARELLAWIDQNRAGIEAFGKDLLDRVAGVLQNDVIPWLEKFGQKLIDYISSPQFKQDMKDLVDKMEQLWKNISTVVDKANTAADKFGGWYNSAKKVYDIVNSLYNLTPNKMLANIISGGMKWAADQVDGRAQGGSVSAGVPYLVGERGPEIIVPKSAGTVIPNHSLAGAGGVTVNQTNHIYTEMDMDRAAKELGFDIAMAI